MKNKTIFNKPGTAKVGIISKARKAQRFENCKMGDPLDFLKLQFVAKYEKKRRGPFRDIFKK